MVGSGLQDIIEMIENEEFKFSSSGILVDCPEDKNLCVKAFRLMQEKFALPNVALHLHKQIPFGAGLGAGSANAVTVLKLCRELFKLNISDIEMEKIAGELGSDTALFVRELPAIARGRGEIIEPIDLSLEGYYIVMVKPEVGVSTAEAYRGVVPNIPQTLPSEIINQPINTWKELLVNDFEPSIFKTLPILQELKDTMYASGAIYASMSGSGSTIYGIFEECPNLSFDHFTHTFKVGK